MVRSMDRDSGADGSARRAPNLNGTRLRILAVGNVSPSVFDPDLTGAIRIVRFADLTPQLLADWQPEIVLSPLVGDGFDCFDLAEILTGAGFAGRYRAAVAALPDPSVVRREIAAQFPTLDFDVLVVGESQR